jgi:hypothetical protein
MIKIRSPLVATALAAPILLLAAAPAFAEERVCRGTIGATTVDNLRVPQYASCVLLGTRVKGTIKVEFNATLRAEDVVVIGNVQAENAKGVRVLDGSRVGGSVQVKQGGGATVSDSRIEGDVQYDSNSAMLRALRNRVGGSIQVFQNTGGVEIRRNVIDGNLQCKENTPRPIGGGNIVGGNREDQCARL